MHDKDGDVRLSTTDDNNRVSQTETQNEILAEDVQQNLNEAML